MFDAPIVIDASSVPTAAASAVDGGEPPLSYRFKTHPPLVLIPILGDTPDALHHKATAMLTESDDEPLPEAPVSVAAVPRQGPARRTAPAIASLIDDDPEAPF